MSSRERVGTWKTMQPTMSIIMTAKKDTQIKYTLFDLSGLFPSPYLSEKISKRKKREKVSHTKLVMRRYTYMNCGTRKATPSRYLPRLWETKDRAMSGKGSLQKPYVPCTRKKKER